MIKIFNTLTEKKEEFLPAGSKIRLFVCGPTVYDFSHIGHARTYIAFDAIARYLRNCGYEVFYLQNITDIDDKIIDRAEKQGEKPRELAQRYAEAYLEDMKNLGINSVTSYAPATDYIDEITSQVKRLKEKGAAYFIEGEGWYFDLLKFPDYGKLSGRTSEAADDAISRIDEGGKKKNRGDFNLWKLSKPKEPSWESDLGRGRPGWHIEDTAITEKIFGPQYEMHGGARDLIFPHHEAEIAQMETISGLKPMVKFWIHTGFLTIGGQKMSKSQGNLIAIRDLLKEYSPEALRFMVLSSHYRSPLDYDELKVRSAAAAIYRIGEFLLKLESAIRLPETAAKENPEIGNVIEEAKNSFFQAMEDDFNTPEALAAVFKLVNEINPLLNSRHIGKENALAIKEFFRTVDEIMGILPPEEAAVPENTRDLVAQREEARNNRDFEKADRLRDKITANGYEVEDTLYGPLIKKMRR